MATCHLSVLVNLKEGQKETLPTFVIEVIDVRGAGDLGDEPGEAMRPANETVPVRRAHFIYSVYRKITRTLKQHTVISYMFAHLLSLFVCRLKAARHEDNLVLTVNFFFFFF